MLKVSPEGQHTCSSFCLFKHYRQLASKRLTFITALLLSRVLSFSVDQYVTSPPWRGSITPYRYRLPSRPSQSSANNHTPPCTVRACQSIQGVWSGLIIRLDFGGYFEVMWAGKDFWPCDLLMACWDRVAVRLHSSSRYFLVACWHFGCILKALLILFNISRLSHWMANSVHMIL